MKKLRDLFISDANILALVIINTIILVTLYFPGTPRKLYIVDDILTVLFTIEMILKIGKYGWKQYWATNWNRFDFIVTISSIPSLITLFLASNGALQGLSLIMIFRTLRIIRIFKSVRIIKFIPGVSNILRGIKRAVKASYFVVFCFVIFLFVASMLSCGLFGKAAPEYFGNPLVSAYTTFQIFSIEGWYEIPNTIAENMGSDWAGSLAKIYFVLLLFGGGMLGMSFVNSIIVDAMAEDNNDEVMNELKEVRKLLEEIKSEQNKKDSSVE